jgi:hypothetical protein
MILRKHIWASLVLVLLLSLGLAAATVSPAQASELLTQTLGFASSNNPTPTCPQDFVFNPKTATCDKVTVTNVTAVVGGKSVSAQSVASGEVIFGVEMHIKGVKVNRKNCFWTKPGQKWGNGYKTGNGVVYEPETTPAQLCHSKKSPTGLIKVAGGKTGRKCFNFAKLGEVPAVTVVIVNSFKVTIPLLAEVSVEVHDTCGSASAHAMAKATISLSKFIRVRGAVSASVFEKAIVNLSTAVQANINCGPVVTTTTTQPGTTVTQPGTTVTQPGTTQTTSTTTTTTTTPAQPPSVSNVTSPEEVYANGETYPNICVDAFGKNGNSLTVVFSANFGSFPSSTFTFTSSGYDRICTTYKAPNDATAVGKNDRITVNVHDNTTGLSGQSAQSMSFPIKAPPPRP